MDPHRSGFGCRQITWISLVIAVGVAGLGFIAFRVGLNSYLHSDSFRQLVSDRTGNALGVNGQYMPLHWTGWSVYSDGFAGTGRETAPLREIKADQIRTDLALRGWFHRTWTVRDLTISRLRAVVATAPSTRARPGARSPTRAMLAGGTWLGSDRFDIASIDIAEATLVWNESLATSGRVTRARTHLEPQGDAWLITATSGSLHQAGLPSLTIADLRLRLGEDHVYVTSAAFRYGETGRINGSGEARLTAPARLDFTLTAQGIPVEPIAPIDWRARLTGALEGSARVQGHPGESADWNATGNVSLQAGVIEALPVLDQIAHFTRTDQFRRVTLQRATATFEWQPAVLRVTNLVLESTGLLRVEGGFTVRERSLDGTLQVGVAATTLRWLPGSRQRVFIEERDGYHWTTVKLTGPLDRVQEDLSPRLVAAAQAEAVEGAKRTIEQGARDVLDRLRPLLP